MVEAFIVCMIMFSGDAEVESSFIENNPVKYEEDCKALALANKKIYDTAPPRLGRAFGYYCQKVVPFEEPQDENCQPIVGVGVAIFSLVSD